MFRLVKIAKRQFRGVSFRDIFTTLNDALFRNAPILVFALDLDRVPKVESDRPGSVEIRKGSIPELLEIRGRLYPLPWEFQCNEYDGVQDFFLACSLKTVEHISWIYYAHDPNRILNLGAREAEIKYCLTLESFRGRGIYPMVLTTVARFLASKGFSRVFICVNKQNTASIRGIQKAGFKCVAEVRLRKVLGVQVSGRLLTAEVRI
jgi:hypothetical protein